MDHMYIRHAIGGKLFYDSLKHPNPYSLHETDGQWTFTISDIPENVAHTIVAHRNELNIFVVPEGKPDHRTWYYSRDGQVRYDPSQKRLVIQADHKQAYTID